MQNTIRIMGIDPGLRNMGWGVIETDGVRLSYIASGVVHSDGGARLSERLASLFDGLTDQLKHYVPHESAVEQTFVNKGATATLKLGQARGIALLAPAMMDILVAEYAPNQVKKTVTGAGHADKTQIHTMLKILLPHAKPQSDDEADALAIAITHAHHRATSRAQALMVG